MMLPSPRMARTFVAFLLKVPVSIQKLFWWPRVVPRNYSHRCHQYGWNQLPIGKSLWKGFMNALVTRRSPVLVWLFFSNFNLEMTVSRYTFHHWPFHKLCFDGGSPKQHAAKSLDQTRCCPVLRSQVLANSSSQLADDAAINSARNLRNSKFFRRFCCLQKFFYGFYCFAMISGNDWQPKDGT